MTSFLFNGLPEGARVFGVLSVDPDATYRCEHIVDIFLANGAKVAIRWNGLDHERPFEIEAKLGGGGAWTWARTPAEAAENAIDWANDYGGMR